MPQLVERGAYDHALNLGKRPVRSQAVSFRCHSQPHLAAVTLYRGSESAVINDLAPDRGDSTRAPQRRWTNQDAASCRSCRLASWIANPFRRIQHEEEKYERRDKQLLREALTVQLHHERGEVVSPTFRYSDECGDTCARVFNVSIR